jgi:ATP-dependent DNA helicase RecQ
MLDRKTVERALASPSWAEVAAAVSRAASEAAEEGERWRLDSIAVAARAIDQGAKGRDAAAQIREMARLCEGGVRISTELLAWTEDVPWADFAMDRHPLPGGVEAVELRSDAPTGHEVLDEIGEFARALRVDPSLRRNIQPEPADGFFARCASHPAYSSDAQKAALRAVVAMPPGGAVVASLPTGWGKSALFQVSTRHWREKDPTACTVVIVPTVALAQDHERTLSKMPGLDGSRAHVGGLKKP